MAPNIKYMVIADNRQIFGLGEDNKIYRWDFATAHFVPYWNRPGEENQQTNVPAGNSQIKL